MTEGDNPIEYEETTETFEGGTRTTRTPKMSDSKDSQDPKPPDDPPEPSGTPTLAAAAGKPPIDTPAHIAQKQRESKLPQDQSEDNSSDE